MPDLVSVIIPAFNAEKTIARAVDSVLAQTYSPVEVIVVDDGSTDGTRDICESYGNRIHYIYQKNKGVSSARNQGIEAAKGYFIGFLDSDDWFLPNKIQTMVTLYSEYPLINCMTSAYYIDDGKSRKPYPQPGKICSSGGNGIVSIFREFSRGNYIIHPNTVLIRTSVFKTIGVFNEHWRFGEDLEMWARIAGQYEWVYSEKPLSVYNRDSINSVCSQSSPDQHGLDFLYTDQGMKTFIKPEYHADFLLWRKKELLTRLNYGLISKNRTFVSECCERLKDDYSLLVRIFIGVHFMPKETWPFITKSLLCALRIYSKFFS